LRAALGSILPTDLSASKGALCDQSFTLVSPEIPGRGRQGLCADILCQFHPSGDGSVPVESVGKRAATTRRGLRKVVKDRAAGDMWVGQRDEEIAEAAAGALAGDEASGQRKGLAMECHMFRTSAVQVVGQPCRFAG
jgi:hypothetical protein